MASSCGATQLASAPLHLLIRRAGYAVAAARAAQRCYCLNHDVWFASELAIKWLRPRADREFARKLDSIADSTRENAAVEGQ
jgi:hypothetical protein